MRNIPTSASILILAATLTACGGSGGSSSNDPAPVDPTDPITPTDPVDPTDPPTTQGSRIGAINVDLDNNGTVDGTATLSYDTNGRITDVSYTYAGDGTPDTFSGISRLLFNDEGQTLEFSYDADGRLSQQIQDRPSSASSVTRLVFNHTWDANNLVTQTMNDFFNAGGGLVTRTTTDLTYNSDLVSDWSEVTENISPAATSNASAVVTYDGNNQPITITYDVGAPTNFTQNLTWDQGRTTTVETIRPSSTETITYTYSPDGTRLIEQLITDGANTEAYTFVYDANDRMTELRIDRDSDGTIDVVETRIWEDGACQSTINWFGFGTNDATLSANSRPYINGTGYGSLSFCEDAGHVQ
ncbi:MAG: hypothetical protein ACRBCK_05605 [Alphaproteobacteria bacterium]